MTEKQTASQTVVVVAMGLVAGAAAVALYLHAGMPGPVAATAALSVYLLLLTVHAFAWRGSEQQAGQPSARDRRDQELRRVKDEARQAQVPGAASGTASSGYAQAARGPHPQSQRPQPQPHQSQSTQASLQAVSQRAANPAHQQGWQQPLPEPHGRQHDAAPETQPMMAPRRDERAMPPPLPANPAAHAGAQAAADAGQNEQQDYWSYRPAAPRLELPPFVTGRASARPAGASQPMPPLEATPARPAQPRQEMTAQPRQEMAAPARQAAAPARQASAAPAPREADVEVIQDAIKRLLEEVNAAEQHETRAKQQQQPAQHFATAQPSPEAAIDRSVDALRMTADTMRTAFGERDTPPLSTPAVSRNAGPPSPPPLPPFVRAPQQPRALSPADARARLMADAISAGRIDVSLEPILGLEDQQTRHYEVSVRLRDADGNPLEITADGPDLRGTGLLPLFDGVRIVRTAAVARRLDDRGKAGSIFSAFSGESVADEHFLGELAESLHQRGNLVSQLVLSFTQSDVRGFSTPEWDSLADMRSLGFRFALSAVTDLDMDFEVLAEQGFAFVKLDASVFLEGLPAPSGRLPSSDVCRHLAKHGLTLVVEHIDNDDKLARVFGFGVLLGQGQLFGGARPVRADVATGRSGYAAA